MPMPCSRPRNQAPDIIECCATLLKPKEKGRHRICIKPE
jgi:hypothetical protein